MSQLRRFAFVLASLVVLLAPAGARAQFMKSLDRRFPQNWCPIDNDDNDLTFTATTDRVKIRIQANNFNGSSWNANRLDNLTIVPKSTFDANRTVTPNYGICFNPPDGPVNYPGYNFSAAGTIETFFDQFDTNAAAWDLTNHAWWDNVSFQASAPHSSSDGPLNDFSGGALALGRQEDGPIQVQSDVTVTGLTPGTLYVVTGWWWIQNLNTLTFTFFTNPCHDDDGDGMTDCAGDCNDNDPKIRPGRAEVCDGRDNDCNGQIDDNAACVKACTTPSKLGTDLRVTNAQFDSSQASVAWNGVDYGMVWHDSRNSDQEIWFTHVTPAGAKVGSEVSLNNNSCSDCTHPRVVWNGSEYAAVYSHNGEIYFHRFDRSGGTVGTDTHFYDTAGSSADDPDIVWTGSEYGVVWDQFVNQQQIRFVRLDKTGNPMSSFIHVTDDTSFLGNSTPKVGWSGSKYGITWQGNDGAHSQIYFELIDPRQGPTLPATQITTHSAGTLAPTIASNGSEFGVAWEDLQTFTEIYFQRISAAGAKVGSNVRITNASGVSNNPSIAWSGAEYGLVWDDARTGHDEIFFARISSAGAKIVATDLQLTTLGDESSNPSLAWGGGKYGVAWTDNSNVTGDVELYFLREGCNCVDADADGQSSCVDCDDAHATVLGGGSQICGDSLNNDCNSATWPLLAGTNEADNDGDGFSLCTNDCNDANATIWATPGEVPSSPPASALRATNKTTWVWSAPAAPGGSADVYDTLRTPAPSNFTSSATCILPNNNAATSTTDATTPSAGAVFYYLVRAENACPVPQGILGQSFIGGVTAAVAGRSCP